MAIEPGKRKLDSDSKQELILKKSQELFRKHGYNKTTITDICNECNMNVGTIYHYFGNKWGILEAIVGQMRISGVLSENISERARDPFKALMEFQLDLATRWSELGVDLTRQFYNDLQSSYFHPVTGTYQPPQALQELGHFIEAAQHAGTFDSSVSAAEIADLFWIIGRGVIYDWCLHNGAYDLIEKTKQDMGWVTKHLIIG